MPARRQPDGGTAFPTSKSIRGGLTVRDYFAGQVIGSLRFDRQADGVQFDLAAVEAYRMADSMLRARSAS